MVWRSEKYTDSPDYFYFIGNCVAFPIKQKALRVDRTAAESFIPHLELILNFDY